ncbi:hypothetical protein [Bacillus smithii]|uniref:hypothetical protein n=1 Tax=Bacillus smithii TaxID=1479 RepID=UPI002E1BD741|nr:hypothetical protein [Bacillus smithii]MED4929161.1 hypothetical protein [Bacillus smithii]
MYKLSQDEFEKRRNEIVERLSKVGIAVRKGQKRPINGQYSGIIGRSRNVLSINIHDNGVK